MGLDDRLRKLFSKLFKRRRFVDKTFKKSIIDLEASGDLVLAINLQAIPDGFRTNRQESLLDDLKDKYQNASTYPSKLYPTASNDLKMEYEGICDTIRVFLYPSASCTEVEHQ